MDPTEDQGLTYKWYCLQKNNNNEAIDFNKKESIKEIVIPTTSLAMGAKFDGCFGNGHGLLSGPGGYTSGQQLKKFEKKNYVEKEKVGTSLCL